MVEWLYLAGPRECFGTKPDATQQRNPLPNMKFRKLAVLLPCPSLDLLPLYQQPDQAEQLLGAWSALWHPALLTSAESLPGWFPAEAPPPEPVGCLLTLPDCSLPLLPGDWAQRAVADGACLVRDCADRDEMVTAALGHLDTAGAQLDKDLAADFLALGYCHMNVELLTYQFRYPGSYAASFASGLDEERFSTEVLAAAERALAADGQAARLHLQSAFDLLYQARQYCFPVDPHLLDLTLVAATTLGRALRNELRGGTPANLLISGELVEQLARRDPATLRALGEAMEKGSAAIVGGEYSEGELPLLTPEAIRARLSRGLAAYQKHLGARPTIFGRRRFGLWPVLPQILKQLGFVGVVHCTLDDGRFPIGRQSRMQWEGMDSTRLEALARVPIDIGTADAFLQLPEKLADAMDLDHAATLVLAHWPGRSSRWYEDLKRIAAYSPALGSFSTITEYFQQSGPVGTYQQYQADQYRPPYLRQAVAGGRQDPISRWVRYFARRASVEALRGLDTLAAAAGCGPAAADGPAAPTTRDELSEEIDDLLAAPAHAGEELDERVRQLLDGAVVRFCTSLGGTGRSPQKGCLLANPWGFPRRICAEIPDLEGLPEIAGAVRAAGVSAGRAAVVVDLPSMGFAWVGPEPSGPPQGDLAKAKDHRRKRRRADEPPLAEENVLCNEFFRVAVDPGTGAVRSIHDYHDRSARLAQQIAMRLPRPARGRAGSSEGDDAEYSIMKAEQLRVTSAGPILGEIVARGRLVDHQMQRLAGFSQTTRIWRGSRVIELLVELDIDQAAKGDPWDSYYAARFAWGDPTANLYRGVSLANIRTEAVQLESPHFVEIRAERACTTLLCGGLPYHRRFGLRRLDTLLVVEGETARRFRLGIGIDLPHPVSAAVGFLAPELMLPGQTPPPVASGWLFHLDARNVLASNWGPLFGQRRLEGFRVRLLETDGRRVRLGLRCLRRLTSARRIDPGDPLGGTLPVDGDQVTIDLRPHEWAEVEARFAV